MWQERNPLGDAKRAADRGEVVFSEGTTFTGSIKSDAPVYIFGQFEGDIDTTSSVVIGRMARVVASIRAHDVGVGGAFAGTIQATGRTEIYAGGRVYGDVTAAGLKIEDGAVFSGRSAMPHQGDDAFLRSASHQLRLVEGAL